MKIIVRGIDTNAVVSNFRNFFIEEIYDEDDVDEIQNLPINFTEVIQYFKHMTINITKTDGGEMLFDLSAKPEENFQTVEKRVGELSLLLFVLKSAGELRLTELENFEISEEDEEELNQEPGTISIPADATTDQLFAFCEQFPKLTKVTKINQTESQGSLSSMDADTDSELGTIGSQDSADTKQDLFTYENSHDLSLKRARTTSTELDSFDFTDNLSDTTENLTPQSSREWYIENAAALEKYLAEDDKIILNYVLEKGDSNYDLRLSMFWNLTKDVLSNLFIIDEGYAKGLYGNIFTAEELYAGPLTKFREFSRTFRLEYQVEHKVPSSVKAPHSDETLTKTNDDNDYSLEDELNKFRGYLEPNKQLQLDEIIEQFRINGVIEDDVVHAIEQKFYSKSEEETLSEPIDENTKPNSPQVINIQRSVDEKIATLFYKLHRKDLQKYLSKECIQKLDSLVSSPEKTGISYIFLWNKTSDLLREVIKSKSPKEKDPEKFKLAEKNLIDNLEIQHRQIPLRYNVTGEYEQTQIDALSAYNILFLITFIDLRAKVKNIINLKSIDSLVDKLIENNFQTSIQIKEDEFDNILNAMRNIFNANIKLVNDEFTPKQYNEEISKLNDELISLNDKIEGLLITSTKEGEELSITSTEDLEEPSITSTKGSESFQPNAVNLDPKTQTIINLLEKYISRVQEPDKVKGLDFFFFGREGRAKNRARNCNFARQLKEQILKSPNAIHQILSEESIKDLKIKTGAKVTNSSELNKAIKTAQSLFENEQQEEHTGGKTRGFY